MKVLISILKDYDNQRELDNIYQQFVDHGFVIHQFIDTNGEVQLESLPAILDYVKGCNSDDDFLERIVVLSNMQPLLFSWYRCYNHLVHDYIYVIDEKKYKNYDGYQNREIVRVLSEFNGIKDETVTGKIYLNINPVNYNVVMDFLLMDDHFVYFDDIQNFDFTRITSPQLKQKVYQFGEYEITFDFLSSLNTETIKLDWNVIANTINLVVDRDFLVKLEHNCYIFVYFAIYILNQNIPLNIKYQLIYIIFSHFGESEKNTYCMKQVIDFLTKKELPFIDKSTLLTASVKLQVKEDLLQHILKFLCDDHENIPFHYPILINSLLYITKNGLKLYPELFKDRSYVMDRILSFYRNHITIDFKGRKRKRIAIVTGQLLQKVHAPTSIVINYATNLKKYFPDYEIKIFVDDMFCFCPEEEVILHLYASNISSKMSTVHSNELEPMNIKVYYSNPELDRISRIQMDINAILDFQPDLLFVMGSDFSFAASYLYPYFPIVKFSFGGAENSPYADLYISGRGETDLRDEYRYYGITSRKYVSHQSGLELPIPKKNIKREDLSIAPNDFVMVTVGNRLAVDMDHEFLGIMCDVLEKSDSIKWVIVGLNGVNQYILHPFRKLIEIGKIIIIAYEEDLAALYQICDIYVNPFRLGGGISGAIAMNQQLPVVSLKNFGDVSVYVGEEDCVEKQMFKDEIMKLYLDREYRFKKGEKMKSRIERDFGMEKAVYEIISLFEMARQEFRNRVNSSN